MKTNLYHRLITTMHPDVSDHPASHERTVMINRYKDNPSRLQELAINWGFDYIEDIEKDDKPRYDCCLECNKLSISFPTFTCTLSGLRMNEDTFINNNLKFSSCKNDYTYDNSMREDF